MIRFVFNLTGQGLPRYLGKHHPGVAGMVVFLDEISIQIGRLSKTDYPPNTGESLPIS